MTDPANVEPISAIELKMSVVGYRVSYDRSLALVRAEHVVQSSARLDLDVQGATVEHHDNRPITFAAIGFTEGPFDPDRVGRLQQAGTDIGIVAKLPQADFPAFWAALRVEREATLACSIVLGTDGVGTDRVSLLEVRGRRS